MSKIGAYANQTVWYWDDLLLNEGRGMLCYHDLKVLVEGGVIPPNQFCDRPTHYGPAPCDRVAVPFVYYLGMFMCDQLVTGLYPQDIEIGRVLGGAEFELGHLDQPKTMDMHYTIDQIKEYRPDGSYWYRCRGVVRIKLYYDTTTQAWTDPMIMLFDYDYDKTFTAPEEILAHPHEDLD
jgi:hypothetical protein